MELDWISLYDYMSIFSRTSITLKINKFYESFYPLKFKKTGKKTFQIHPAERVGFLGIISVYIQQMLFALEVYLQAEYFLNTGKIKEDIKLSKMFVEIQKKNLQLSLELERYVYIIAEASKAYNGKSDEKVKQKGFLQIKLICSLNRIFQFCYFLNDMKNNLDQEGYQKVYSCLKLFSYNVCQKSKNHIKLFPQMGQVLVQILSFFYSDQKIPFNFHSHLMEDNNQTTKKKTFPQKVKKLFAVIPNKQKSIFVNLNDEYFCEYLGKQGFVVPKQVIQNYFRCQQQINSIIAEEQNFIQSILVAQIYRGKRQWKKKVTQQLVNLSVQKKMTKNSKLLQSKEFKLSDDFPLFLNN